MEEAGGKVAIFGCGWRKANQLWQWLGGKVTNFGSCWRTGNQVWQLLEDR